MIINQTCIDTSELGNGIFVEIHAKYSHLNQNYVGNKNLIFIALITGQRSKKFP